MEAAKAPAAEWSRRRAEGTYSCRSGRRLGRVTSAGVRTGSGAGGRGDGKGTHDFEDAAEAWEADGGASGEADDASEAVEEAKEGRALACWLGGGN